jgi:hypothetical protein
MTTIQTIIQKVRQYYPHAYVKYEESTRLCVVISEAQRIGTGDSCKEAWSSALECLERQERERAANP